MKIDHSAFDAVPALRDKILDPGTSQFRFLDFTDIDRRAREAGYPVDWRRPDDEREATRRAVLGGMEGSDIWVFAYGSLMWDPGFYFEDVRIARVEGFARRFCLHMDKGRGSPETPGFMAALDDGRYCDGLAFRIAAELVDHETAVIWRREMIAYGYKAVFVPADIGGEQVHALTFVADHATDRYAGDVDLDRSARMIATAQGINGTNLDYISNLAAQLEILGLSDPDFEELHARTQEFAQAVSANG